MDATDLRAYLVTNNVFPNCGAPGAIQVNVNDQTAPSPRIWIQQGGGVDDVFYDGSVAMGNDVYDLEVIGINTQQTIDIVGTVKDLLNGYHGAFGTSWALSVFVTDKDGNYIPVNADSDEGYNVAALTVEINS